MKPDYDFEKGVRGKFFRPDASIRVAVYVDLDIHEVLSAKAEKKGIGVDEIVNELLRQDVAIIETAG
jgi:hypothetical protein